MNFRVVAFASVVACVCGCSSTDTDTAAPLATTSSALTAPPQIPLPCTYNGAWQSTWDGTIPELYFADALAQCSSTAAGGFQDITLLDVYGQLVEGYMSSAVGIKIGPTSAGVTAAWAATRQDPTQNCDQGLTGNGQPITYQSLVVQESIPFSSPTTAEFAANTDLRTAGVNLCIAQLLNQSMPGTAGGEALLFSASEQRELLETIRERAQIAMLQYALLGEAFALPPAPPRPCFRGGPARPGCPPLPLDPQQRMGVLNGWARGAASSTLTAMGNDFAAAVQLHAVVSGEIASLLARSRSARLPRTAASLGFADDQWGYGSWFQREMTMMFGGDPLAITTTLVSGQPEGTGAWADPAGLQTPGVWGNDFPSFTQAPYVEDRTNSPQVMELLRMASAYDALYLQSATPPDPHPPCGAYDASATGNWIYSQVEYNLELNECAVQGTTCPSAPPTVPSGGDLSAWLLWTKYQITPTHALTLGQYLVEALSLPPSSSGRCGAATTLYDPQDSFVGALAVAGHDANQPARPTFDPGTGHVSPQALLTPRSLAQLAPGYGRSIAIRFASASEMAATYYGDVGSFGFDGLCMNSGGSGDCAWGQYTFGNIQAENKRLLGALGAQAAVREMLLDGLAFAETATNANSGITGSFLAHADDIVRVIDGAAGSAVSLRPAVTTVTLPGETLNSFGQPEGDGLVRVPVLENATTSGGLPIWNVTATVDSTDPWWTTAGADYVAYALQDPHASDLATHPEAAIGTTTISSLVSAAEAAGLASVAATSLPVSDSLPLVRWQFALPIPLRQDASLVLSSRFTAVVARIQVMISPSAASRVDYRLLAGNVDAVEILPNAGLAGQYYAASGSLGVSVQHQATPYMDNPQEPAFDGFDLPNHWVPPFNAVLLGGMPSQPSAPAYLDQAQTAATNAAAAVNTALTDMQQEETDIAQAQAAAVQAAATVQQNRDILCGIGNTTCDLVVRAEPLNPALFPNVPSPQNCGGGDVNCSMNNMVAAVLTGFTQSTYYVADAVDQQLLASNPPTFVSYNGGSLQSAFITQWGAIRSASEKVAAVSSALSAAQSQITAAMAVLQGQKATAAYECSPQVFQNAEQDCETTSNSVSVGVSAGFPGGVSASVTESTSQSFNDGPLHAQEDKCTTQANMIGGDVATAAAAVASALSSVSSALLGVVDAETAIVQSSASIQTLLNQANVADAQAQLEAKLTASTLQTSTGLWRVYTQADAWRAMALLNNARQYALAARRAIEAQYVVDLSTMTQTEAFVASPATWANDVYTYDLSMPSAVGLSIGSSGGGVYSNQVVDYVGNLQGFVSGYSVNRPTAVAQDEIDIENLPGLAPGGPVTLTGGNYYPATAGWNLHCPPDPSNGMQGAWIGPPTASTTGDVDTVCTISGAPGKPDIIKLDFSLDPWGRLNGDVANPPFVDRYNVRWGQLALNFVGTGIKDCTLAVDPPTCYQSEWIAYNLTQGGPSWITDFEEIWNLLATPTTTIEGAKGLAAEVWLDPLQDGWSTPYISAIARTEYQLAPVGGNYELQVNVAPEVVLSNIQRIQLMVGSSAWVAQQQPSGG